MFLLSEGWFHRKISTEIAQGMFCLNCGVESSLLDLILPTFSEAASPKTQTLDLLCTCHIRRSLLTLTIYPNSSSRKRVAVNLQMAPSFLTFLLDLFVPVPKSTSSSSPSSPTEYSPEWIVPQQVEIFLLGKRRLTGLKSGLLNFAVWCPPATTVGVAAAGMGSVQRSVSRLPLVAHQLTTGAGDAVWDEVDLGLKGDFKEPGKKHTHTP